MRLGKIEYLNLLPFYVFLKRHSYQILKKSIEGVPSKINLKFAKKQVDFAFISSIKAQKCFSNLGIIASDEVLSVLVDTSSANLNDNDSETSNQLAKILNINGQVIIGDKALKLYFSSNKDNLNNLVDLSKEWKKRFDLPFVFAKLCTHKYTKSFKIIEKKFFKTHIFIPNYELEKYSKKLNLSKKQIKYYLTKIDYKCNHKTQKSLRLFYKLLRK